MSRKPLGLFILAVALVAVAPPALALSLSQADLLFPSYGQATHYDQSFEYLGDAGTVADGVSWSFAPGLLNLTVRPNVGDRWGHGGDYEYLSVWIDWDLSRTFDADERVVNLRDEWFAFGIHPMTFQIERPMNTETWMRTRFSYDGSFGATGNLYTGEVEDYLLRPGEVPEPTSLVMLGLVGLGAVVMGRKRRR